MRKTFAPVIVVGIVRCLSWLVVVVVIRDLDVLGRTRAGHVDLHPRPSRHCARVPLRSASQALVRWRRASAPARRLRDDPNVDLPAVIGEAIADPSLEVAYWTAGPVDRGLTRTAAVSRSPARTRRARRQRSTAATIPWPSSSTIAPWTPGGFWERWDPSLRRPWRTAVSPRRSTLRWGSYTNRVPNPGRGGCRTAAH